MKPATPSARVAKSRRAAVAAGAARIDVILRDPDAIAALSRLSEKHGGVTAAVTAALRNTEKTPVR